MPFKDPIKKKQYAHEYGLKNREKLNSYYYTYASTHREALNIARKLKRSRDLNYKLRECLRHRMYMLLGSKHSSKRISAKALVGCSLESLKTHLESKFHTNIRTGEMMTWENYGKNGWHVDHIIPCASFHLTDPEQQKICFHYTNLQPLWWWENLEKSAKILGELDDRETIVD